MLVSHHPTVRRRDSLRGEFGIASWRGQNAGVALDYDLDHVAVACERQADAWPRYAGDLGGRWIGGGPTVGFSSAQVEYANGMRLEVLEPFAPERNDFLRRFLDRRGPGPHHLTYKVADIETALDEVEAAGYRPVGVDLSDPMWKESFLHPKDAPGIVVQIAQAAEGEWSSEPPPGHPQPRTDRPATLSRVVHAVADLDDGLRLFAGLLRGETLEKGEDQNEDPWVELGWPGPGRLRLVAPANAASPVAQWLAGAPGRVHHIAFTCDAPHLVPDAVARSDGRYEIAADRNGGVRLLLEPVGYA